MSDEINDITEINFNFFINFFLYLKDIVLDIFITFAPSVNYLFQVCKFNKTKSSKGFSNYLCLSIILSHTLKVLFWFGTKFKYTLLFQSIFVILMQLYLIYLYIKYKEDNVNLFHLIYTNNTSFGQKITNFIFNNLFDWSETLKSKLIWRWNKAIEYYKFYFLIIFILSLFSFIIDINNIYYINAVGVICIILEMICSLTLLYEIQKTKNQKNISVIMVFMWLIGNILKLYYNIVNNSPIQLIISSYIQVFFNCLLIYQIYYYHKKNKSESINNSNTDKLKFIDSKEEKQKEEIVELNLIDNNIESNKIDYL